MMRRFLEEFLPAIAHAVNTEDIEEYVTPLQTDMSILRGLIAARRELDRRYRETAYDAGVNHGYYTGRRVYDEQRKSETEEAYKKQLAEYRTQLHDIDEALDEVIARLSP
jgi:hypothetical protein